MESEDAQVYPLIAFPPVAGATHVTTSLSTPAVAVGAAGLAGTVVAVIDEDVVPAEDPAAFVPTTVNVYAVFDARPWKVYVVLVFPVVTVYVDGVVVIV